MGRHSAGAIPRQQKVSRAESRPTFPAYVGGIPLDPDLEETFVLGIGQARGPESFAQGVTVLG